MRDRVSLVFADEDVARFVVPGRNLVTPPELAADAPVLDVFQPLVIGGRPVLGDETDLAIAHRGQCRFGDGLATAGTGLAVDAHVTGQVEEPLVGQHRLDHRVGTLADRHLQLVLLRFDEKSQCFEVGEDLLARGKAIQAAIGRGCIVDDLCIEGEDDDGQELVSRADLRVIEIMRRRDLHATGAELAFDIGVGDDRNLAIGQRQFQRLANQMPKTLVVRMHGHGDVAKHGFRARGGDHQAFAAIAGRVADRPQAAVLLLAVDLEIGHRRHQHRIPVDQATTAIEQAVAIPGDEHAAHGSGQPLVHGEAFTRPVDRGADPTHLVADRRAGFLLPFPDPLDELFTAEIVARLAGGGELVFDDLLRGDAGVVGSALPQRA